MKTILVVDDEFGNAEVLGLILQEEGYRAFCAADGREGLAKIGEVRPDLVVMDFMMPVMNGAEMGRALRESEKTRGIKIILCSGLSEAVVAKEWAAYDRFLRKPYNVAELLGQIGVLLE